MRLVRLETTHYENEGIGILGNLSTYWVLTEYLLSTKY